MIEKQQKHELRLSRIVRRSTKILGKRGTRSDNKSMICLRNDSTKRKFRYEMNEWWTRTVNTSLEVDS